MNYTILLLSPDHVIFLTIGEIANRKRYFVEIFRENPLLKLLEVRKYLPTSLDV